MSNEDFNSTLIRSTKTLKPLALYLTKSSNDADDLLQEMVYRALKCREKLAEDSNMNAWLYTILKNLFINNYRRHKKIKEIVDSGYLKASHYPNAITLNEGESNIEYSSLNSELNKLSNSYRKPFMMHFNGYKYEEIAKDLNMPIGTIKSRIHIAKKLLQKKLKQESRIIN